MSGPQRKPDQTAVSVSMSKALVVQIDERAKKLGLTRSQFLVQLARADLHQRGDLTLRESPAPEQVSSPKVESVALDLLQRTADSVRKTRRQPKP